MLEDILRQEKDLILKNWFNSIFETYPANSQKFFTKTDDQFANPVGYTMKENIDLIYEELLHGFDQEKLSLIIEKIVKVRAVQDFSPSQSVGLFFLLKKVIRDELQERLNEGTLLEDFLKFESKLDTIALIAFDIYTSCREKISEIRINEVKNSISGLLKSANLLCELPE